MQDEAVAGARCPGKQIRIAAANAARRQLHCSGNQVHRLIEKAVEAYFQNMG